MFSNYTIKQALPRLIIAAIAINLSYWICALAVDASNLLGNSVYHLLSGLAGKTILEATAIPELYDVAMRGVQNVQGAATGTAATAGVAALAAAIFVPTVGMQIVGGIAMLLISLAVGIAAAVLIALIVLAARQAIIIVLIVVAPIAFALYILPGTKTIFDKWRKLLVTMLVFFPLFAALFGGAQLAGNILIGAAAEQPRNTAATPASGQYAAALLIMGLGAQFAPLFLAPWLLRNSTGILGQFANRMQQRSKGVTSALNKKSRENLGQATKRTWGMGRNRLRRYASDKSDTRRGRALAWAMSGGARRKAIDKTIEAEEKQHNTEYVAGSDRYSDFAKRTIAAEQTKSMVKEQIGDEAKIDHLADNQALYLRTAASSAKAQQAKTSQAQLEEELKSEEGRRIRGYVPGGKNEELAAAAKQLGDASSAAYISEQAKNNAGRILTGEHAAHTKANAALAGGIDKQFGAQRAEAMADNIIEQQMNEGVKIERSSLGSKSDANILQRALKGVDEQGKTLSTEARMAAASELSNRGYAANHIELFRQLNKQMSDAAQPHYAAAAKDATLARANFKSDEEHRAAIEDYVDRQLIEDKSLEPIRFMQKQALNDIGGNIPFAVGDGTRGAMGRGVGRADFDKEWAYRLTKKPTAATIQKFKKEDTDWILENFTKGNLGAEHAAAFQARADEILASSTDTANTKPEIKEFFDELKARGLIQRSFDLPKGGGNP